MAEMKRSRTTTEYKDALIYGIRVKVKIETIYNITPTHYVATTPCPVCPKTALREHPKQQKAFQRSVDNMKTHYEAIHIRNSRNPTQKKP